MKNTHSKLNASTRIFRIQIDGEPDVGTERLSDAIDYIEEHYIGTVFESTMTGPDEYTFRSESGNAKISPLTLWRI